MVSCDRKIIVWILVKTFNIVKMHIYEIKLFSFSKLFESICSCILKLALSQDISLSLLFLLLVVSFGAADVEYEKLSKFEIFSILHRSPSMFDWSKIVAAWENKESENIGCSPSASSLKSVLCQNLSNNELKWD